MKKQWFKGGKRIIIDSKRILCDKCPCNNIQWIATGYDQKIYTSENGIDWTGKSLSLEQLWNVAYNGYLWVIVGYRSGYSYCILTSPDGINWTPRTSPYYSSSRGICWGNDLWVIGHYRRISTSPDGINWTLYEFSEYSPSGYLMSTVNGIGWNGSLFVAVGSSSVYLTSPDGVNWTMRELPCYYYDCVWWRPVWNGSIWVMSGGGYIDGTSYCILTSSDGINWNSSSSIINQAYGLAWNGYLFVAGGLYGEIITSPDGVNWTQRESPFNSSIFDIAWNGSLFVAVSEEIVSGHYEGKIATSPDGINWTERLAPSNRLMGVCSAVSPNLYPPIGV